ncbi:NAD(P)-dependent oxidoreductase [Pseudaestuariivita rosea]|uniref:NAD(P)-dependent oxidoreductase n=1 Tax=Pseudaestuariivita rosea TaxID=2763263 RepID=UPI003AF532CD
MVCYLHGKRGSIMKVLIIGATGKISRHTIAEVATLGHDVTAFGRSVERIKPFERLTVVKGDVTNAQDLAAAMPCHDVVILTFGAPLNRKTIFSEPTSVKLAQEPWSLP